MIRLGPRFIDYGQPVDMSAPLNRGLVSWWLALPQRMGGSRFLDLCGRNHGTLTNNPTWVGARGRPGGWGALSFDGSNDYVSVSSSAISSEGSVILWMNSPSSHSGGRDEHVFGGDNGSSAEFVFRHYSDNNLYIGWNGFSGDDRVVVAASSANWRQNEWSQYAITWTNGGSTDVYVNASSIGSQPNCTTGSLSSGFRIGSTVTFGVNTFLGYQDDIRLFNRKLSASEVAAIYHDSRTGNPSTLNWRRRYTVFDVGGGAAPSFKSAYERNCNSVWTVSAR